MPLRRPSPPDGTAAAERVAGLLRPRGWVPELAPGDDDAEADFGGHDDSLAAPASDEARSAAGHPGVLAGADVPPSSGQHRVRGAWERLRGGRVDPGRGGAVALAVVAVLAVLFAVVLVVRGRPSAVDAPIPAVPAAIPAVAAPGVPMAVHGSVPPVSGPPVAGPVGSPTAAAGEVVVSVAGSVRRPGLVHLPAGSRVDDAVRAAGGLRPGSTFGLLNLARRLVDGEQVLVGPGAPIAGGVGAGSGSTPSGTAASTSGPVDLNAATVADLDGLPGIGPVLAQRIIDWRTAHGRFGSVDQLREVSGIGESKFAQLRDQVTV